MTCAIIASALLVLVAFADARRCAPELKAIPCGNFSGLVYSADGGPAKRVSKVSDWQAPNITAHSTFVISVCNFGNLQINDTTVRGTSFIPSLVGWVGEYARVRVLVHNSGNLDVHHRLVIGMVLPEGKRYRWRWRWRVGFRRAKKVSAPDTAVIGKIVDGLVGDDAHVAVEVRNSGNVRLLAGARDLHIGKGTLMNEVLNAPKPPDGACANYVCYEILVANSANVKGEDGKAAMYIRDGQLDDETLDTGCLGRDAFVNITKLNVANVDNVAKLHIYDGELSDEAVDAANLLGAIVNVNMNDVGNVRKGGDVRIVDGELVDEVIDAKHVDNAYINVRSVNIGNVVGDALTVIDGELVDEMVDVGALIDADVLVSLKDVGNVRVTGGVKVSEAELVDEVVDCSFVKNTDVSVDMRNVGNVVAHDVRVDEGELVDEVLDCKLLMGGKINLKLKDVGNVRAKGAVDIFRGELVDEIIDCGLIKRTDIIIDERKVGNVVARDLTIKKGELVDEVIDSTSLIEAKIRVKLKNVGNAYVSHALDIFKGELVDEVVDTGYVKDSDLFVEMDKVGNARAKTVIIRQGELVDEVLDSKSIIRGSFQLKLNDVANVRCLPGATLNVTEGELLETVADITGVVQDTRASVRIVRSGYANLHHASISYVNATAARKPVEVSWKNSGVEVVKISGTFDPCPLSA